MAMNGAVRTVLGDVAADVLGPTDYHEHLFQTSPLLPGDELDDEVRSREEARLLHTAGIATMVDATPIGLGRNPAGLARISAALGLGIVATTGAHREAHYPAGHWLRDQSADRLAGLFIAELEIGQPFLDGPDPGDPAHAPSGELVRSGVLKAGIGYWSISAFEHRVLEAVAAAHSVTGAPVMVHLEHGSAAVEVLDRLVDLGVAPSRVALAHIDRNPDPGLHGELAQAGAYLGYDGMARTRDWPESVLLDCLERCAQGGGSGRILLGGDVARRSRYVTYGGLPGLAYLPLRFVPRVERLGGPDLVRSVLVENPARWLAWA